MFKKRDSVKKHHIIIGIIFFSLMLILVIYVYVINHYKITNVTVEGNVHYTSDEISQIVMTGQFGDNSLYLSMKYRNKSVDTIPFVETMDVTIVDSHSIKIRVYEKSLAGYIEYLGNYLYFDKDGIVVESSDIKTSSIPQVTGLTFDHVVLYDVLPVENEAVFNQILDITQLLEKYGIYADKIYFDSNYEMTLFFGSIKAAIGTNEYIDEKIMELKEILPNLEGKSGTIELENYTEDKENTTFKSD